MSTPEHRSSWWRDPGWWNPAATIIAALISIGGIVLGLWLSGSLSRQRPETSATPVHGRSSATPTPSFIDMEAVNTGDCLKGSDLHLNNRPSALPTSVQVVPCDEPHAGEVFFSANRWPKKAPYPGHNVLYYEAAVTCMGPFRTYVGIDYQRSILDYVVRSPSARAWRSGDRRMFCIVYDPHGPLQESVRRFNH